MSYESQGVTPMPTLFILLLPKTFLFTDRPLFLRLLKAIQEKKEKVLLTVHLEKQTKKVEIYSSAHISDNA